MSPSQITKYEITSQLILISLQVTDVMVVADNGALSVVQFAGMQTGSQVVFNGNTISNIWVIFLMTFLFLIFWQPTCDLAMSILEFSSIIVSQMRNSITLLFLAF